MRSSCCLCVTPHFFVFSEIAVVSKKSRRLVKCRGKAIPGTGREDLYGCETSRLPHFLDNQLTYGGEIVSLTQRPAALYHQEDSCCSFLLEAESTPGAQCGWKD
jgi:hypothetical protein